MRFQYGEEGFFLTIDRDVQELEMEDEEASSESLSTASIMSGSGSRIQTCHANSGTGKNLSCMVSKR